MIRSLEVWASEWWNRVNAAREAREATAEELRPNPWLKRGKIVGAILLSALVVAEIKTSWVQSRILAALAKGLTYTVRPGPNPSLRFPQSGPYNEKLGYTRIPVFVRHLSRSGYEVAAQARPSWLFQSLTRLGFFPIYREKTGAGLVLVDRSGQTIFEARYPSRVYSDFESIPPVVVKTLLFIENREMLDERYPYQNPSVEWDRFFKAVVDYGYAQLNPGHPVSGGSTLATQLEKMRHSPGGRTRSASEKLRQMGSASLRAYLDGEQTLAARKRIVRDYINSIPLAGIRGYGEVSGLGDGLWAWFGADFDRVNELLRDAEHAGPSDPLLAERGRAYRQVLTLLLALNKPAVFLTEDRAALDARAERYLRLLAREGIISAALRDAALKASPGYREAAPAAEVVPFSQRKGRDSVRVELLSLLNVGSTYELDRLDLKVTTTLDKAAQQAVTEVLHHLGDRDYVAQAGLVGERLLGSADPSQVIYSFTLYERGPGANLLRVQADNYNGPLNINEQTKLELGSTAKLRTLITYLEIIRELHGQLAALPAPALAERAASAQDPLTRWAADYLAAAADRSLSTMLEAAMSRRYSASPGEAFFTGGGLHYFANFDKEDNGRILTVREAFQRSVNLVFIRLMRDIVSYYTVRLPAYSPAIFSNPEHPLRQRYLERFADQEGRIFLSRFYEKYRGLSGEQALETLVAGLRPATAKRLAVVFRSVRPEAGPAELGSFLRAHLPAAALSDSLVEKLYRDYAPEKFDLQDRGYLARVHPLELWLVEYKFRNPGAGWSQIVAASARERQEVYRWLFRPNRKAAQDKRIRILLEEDAFREIHRAWKKLGYPFDRLVPSYATAIGSSGDTPAALAELAGIIVNGGLRYPSVRIERLEFAEHTPFETVVAWKPQTGERVLPAEIAAFVKREMIGVVEQGTGRRMAGGITLEDGRKLEVGGKTGTGDNRFEVYAHGGRPVGSRVLNRTATFVFFVGDRFFGTITAFVPGRQAASYGFTSALPVAVFKHLAPFLKPVLAHPQADEPVRPLLASRASR
jgi:membrane peptidoglycan carboxypeptidase